MKGDCKEQQELERAQLVIKRLTAHMEATNSHWLRALCAAKIAEVCKGSNS